MSLGHLMRTSSDRPGKMLAANDSNACADYKFPSYYHDITLQASSRSGSARPATGPAGCWPPMTPTPAPVTGLFPGYYNDLTLQAGSRRGSQSAATCNTLSAKDCKARWLDAFNELLR